MTRRIGQALTLVVLLTSGTYLLVYLYRWEWNRALVSGLFFVAAEVALVASSLLRRLRAIEAQLAAGVSPAAPPLPARPGDALDPDALARIRESAPERSSPFAWLESASRSTNVFVPVLLGAGVVLSLLAHAVERLAGATATPALERRLAARLAPLSLPIGGLLGAPGSTPFTVTSLAPLPRPTIGARAASRAFVAAVAVFAVLATVQAIDTIADATQTRPDVDRPGVSSELTFSVATKARSGPNEATAEALWVACRGVLNRRVTATPMEALGGGTYRLTISPALGQHAQRRFVGCLEDATLDKISGSVVSLVDVAAR